MRKTLFTASVLAVALAAARELAHHFALAIGARGGCGGGHLRIVAIRDVCCIVKHLL